MLSSGQILVAQNLLDRLGLQVGDSLKIGDETLTISDVVLSEPDQPVDFFSLGPRIFLSANDLDATGLIMPGSRVAYRALIQVVDENQIEAVAARLIRCRRPTPSSRRYLSHEPIRRSAFL